MLEKQYLTLTIAYILCVDRVIYTDYGLSWRNRVDIAHIFRFWDQEEMYCVFKFRRNIYFSIHDV